MTTLATLTNGTYTVYVTDWGGIEILRSGISHAAIAGPVVYWKYYNWESELGMPPISYPSGFALVSSGATSAIVETTVADGYGNVVTLKHDFSLDGASIYARATITVDEMAGNYQLVGVGHTWHYYATLGSAAQHAGEYVVSCGNEIETTVLGSSAPLVIEQNRWEHGDDNMYLGVREAGWWLGVSAWGCGSVGAYAGAGYVDLGFSMLPRILADFGVGSSYSQRHHITVLVATTNTETVRTTLAARCRDMLVAHGDVQPNPWQPVYSNIDKIQPGYMQTIAVGVYDQTADIPQAVAYGVKRGQPAFVWGPQRICYVHPSYTSAAARGLSVDPWRELLKGIRDAGASQIIVRIWPISGEFRQPDKTIIRCNGEYVDDGYGMAGYPRLSLVGNPEHPDMQAYWEQAEELCASYDFDVLSIEEFYYSLDSYSDDDLAAYAAWMLEHYGQVVTEWERVSPPVWWANIFGIPTAADGKIVKFWSRTITEWRNDCLKIYYAKWKRLLSRYGKKLMIEVRWSIDHAGVFPEDVESALDAPGATWIDEIGWRANTWIDAADHRLYPDDVDMFLIWFYWDIWSTLVDGQPETSDTPDLARWQEYFGYLRNRGGLTKLHVHLGPAYKLIPAGAPMGTNWWTFSDDKWLLSLEYLRRISPFQMSCEFGVLPGLHGVQATWSPGQSASNESVVRGVGDYDKLANWKDVVLSAVGNSPGASDYVIGVDCVFEGWQEHKLQWLTSNRPAIAATYYVSYTYTGYAETYSKMAVPDYAYRQYVNRYFKLIGLQEI